MIGHFTNLYVGVMKAVANFCLCRDARFLPNQNKNYRKK